jgi:hypothetical protein
MVFLPRVRALIFLFFFGGDIFSRGAIWCSSGVLCYFFPLPYGCFFIVVQVEICRPYQKETSQYRVCVA